ncbi:MAG: type I DNA topoisomerase, partial [Candidatus Saccharimonadales bacterium]
MPKKDLVIVESPAKAKTIEKYLGSDYEVKSSFGHIRDLPKKGLNIDIDHDFEPHYELNPDKKKIVAELKKSAKAANIVWLASDEDREGEAIAWHLCKALGLNPNTTKRIVFHEITKTAIDNAIKNPRIVDIKLVDAQQARRVLDRLVGYELSPILWRKIRTGLSAGRVQSVAVRLCVDREREIKDFKSKTFYKLTANFSVATKHQEFPAELNKSIDNHDQAKRFIEAVKNSTYKVESAIKKPGFRSPPPPFTTSTLQQEAARRLSYGVRQTMSLAQKLYENGHISYMRTDSTLMSLTHLNESAAYINKTFGEKYYHRRQYKTKNASAQEAHEAIQPSNVTKLDAGSNDQEKRLYQLIWQRTVASQMSPAKVERTEVTISISGHSEKFVAKGEILKFDGFLKVSGNIKDDTLLPPLVSGNKLDLKQMKATESFTRPPARYSEATLVRKLEELGIGRPSTYAPTISTIQSREYIDKKDIAGVERPIKIIVLEKGKLSEQATTIITGADRSKLVPTLLAEIINDFLTKYFSDIVDYDFTAGIEKDFDRIADGAIKWPTMIKKFYKQFHPLVTKSSKVSREEVTQARTLGIDPKTKQPIVVRFGRFGPVLQRGSTDNDEKPDFAPLPKDSDMDTVTLEQAIETFKLPRVVGKTEKGEEITANIGRFGPYIQVGKIFVSIKELDPHVIKEAEARELYEDKLKQLSKKIIKEFNGGIKILNGPYGPYITDGKKNVPIPKSKKPISLTVENCKTMLEMAPVRKRFRQRRA